MGRASGRAKLKDDMGDKRTHDGEGERKHLKINEGEVKQANDVDGEQKNKGGMRGTSRQTRGRVRERSRGGAGGGIIVGTSGWRSSETRRRLGEGSRGLSRGR